MFKIDKFELLTLTILFEIGSTTLFALGFNHAKQDAWISILIALVLGWGILWGYTRIQLTYPDKDLGMIIVTVCGKWIGRPLALLYAIYFFYVSSFNFWEFGDLMVSSILRGTPLEIILIINLVIVLYAIFLGIEVIARAGLLLIPYFLFFLLLVFFLIFTLGNIDLNQMKPVLENGIIPVLQGAYEVINVPYGEMVVFLVYWKYMNNKQKILKTSIIGVSISGIMLCISIIVIISGLGINRVPMATFPLLNVTSNIKMIDALVVIAIFIGGFFKITLHLYASVLLIQSLFKKIRLPWIIMFNGLCLYFFSIFYFESTLFHRWVGFNVFNPYISSGFQIIIPSLLGLIIWIQSSEKGK